MAREEIEVFDEDQLYGCAWLYASVFSEPWGEPWTTEKARERLAETYYSPGFEGLVCVVGGEPVGLTLGNRVRRAVGRGFLLHEFCVRAEMQGARRGRGRQAPRGPGEPFAGGGRRKRLSLDRF